MEEYELEHTGCARQEAVLVRGGNRLCGELTVQGAKNSTLPLLAAALLCEGETVLHNCPALSVCTRQSPFCGGSDAAVPTRAIP